MKRIFISHASEDKAAFVRQLAHTLRARGVDVWYDEFSLKPGDSIREGIEKGLASCDSGVCIFSPNYFKKKWTKDELGGFFAKEVVAKSNLLIPVWLDLTFEELVTVSPMLADRLAIRANDGHLSVSRQIIQSLIDEKRENIQPGTDRSNRYYNPPNDIPLFGYRFAPKMSYPEIASQLRERELVIAYWQHDKGYMCACHIGCEERFFEVARDAEVEFYAVDRLKVQSGFDVPLPEG